MLKKSALFSILLIPAWAFATSETSETFTVHGQFFDESGTRTLSSVVDVTLGIYDPSGACLLYEEVQTGIDLSKTDGHFSLQLGSAQGANKRTARDRGKKMSDVFVNAGTFAVNPHCTKAYTPAAGDTRNLRITVTPQGGAAITLAPDEVISGVPYALVAETFQGKTPGQFIQVENHVTQSNLNTLTGGTSGTPVDASSLHHHDSQYMRVTGSGGFTSTGGAIIGASSVPANTQFQVTATSASNTGLVVQGASGQTADLMTIKDNSGTPLFVIDKSGSLAMSSRSTLKLGSMTNVQESAVSFTDGMIWFNSSTGSVKYYNGSIQTLSGGSDIVAITGGSINGTPIGSTTAASGTFTTLTTTGNVGVGTSSPAAKLDVQGQARTSVHNLAGGSAIDWNNGNIQYTGGSYGCQAFTMNNLLDGAAYTLLVNGPTGTCTFSASGLTINYMGGAVPGAITSKTAFNFVRAGSDVLVTWIGF